MWQLKRFGSLFVLQRGTDSEEYQLNIIHVSVHFIFSQANSTAETESIFIEEVFREYNFFSRLEGDIP